MALTPTNKAASVVAANGNRIGNAPPEARKRVVMDARLDEGLRVELMTITPDIAAKWLKRNHVNRPLRRRHVVSYANAIRAGEWDDANGETIIFSDEHDLIDGQHRLTAVVEAQRAIVSLVVFGIKSLKRRSVDTGAKRELGDIFSMHGEKNTTKLASTLRVLHAYEQGMLLQTHGGLTFTSYGAAEEFLRAHPGLQEAVADAGRIKSLLRVSMAGTLLYLFRRINAPLTDHLIGTLGDGHLRTGCEAFLELRERLLRIRLHKERLHPIEPFVYTIKAWNSTRKGKTLKIFKWRDDEGIPEIL